MYAVLHLADFALQAVLRTEPGAGAHPAALFADSGRKSTVLTANAPARHCRVEVGMTAPQAVARCPALLIRVPRAEAESEAQAALLAVAFTVSPAIEDTAPGVCTIDLKGAPPSLYHAAAAAAVRQLESLGFLASAGIAATPLLALFAARQAAIRNQPQASDSTATQLDLFGEDAAPSAQAAEASAEYAASSPVLVVSDAAAFLDPLPLSTGSPTPEVATVLASWGVRTLGQLTALSRDDVGRRLGPDGLEAWDRARGGAPRPLHRVSPTHSFEAAMDFENEIETLEPLLFILRRFLERLTLELRTAGLVAAELGLTLLLADEAKHARTFRLPDPNADADILFRTLHTHLESLHTDSPIAGVKLHVTPVRPLVRQQGLFDTGLRDPHGFAETLARIVAIVGSDRVGTPRLEDTHRPDAVTLVPPAAVIPPPAAPPPHPITGPPLRRFRPALRAQLELVDGRPTYLWTDQFSGAIAEVRGPWLGSGDWWQADRAWRRTEYDVALVDGGLYRLILTDRTWYVEGEYD